MRSLGGPNPPHLEVWPQKDVEDRQGERPYGDGERKSHPEQAGAYGATLLTYSLTNTRKVSLIDA